MKNEGTVPSPAQHQQGANEAKRSSVELRSLNEFFSLLKSCMGLTTSPDIDAIANYGRAPGFRTLLPCSVWEWDARSIARQACAYQGMLRATMRASRRGCAAQLAQTRRQRRQGSCWNSRSLPAVNHPRDRTGVQSSQWPDENPNPPPEASGTNPNRSDKPCTVLARCAAMISTGNFRSDSPSSSDLESDVYEM